MHSVVEKIWRKNLQKYWFPYHEQKQSLSTMLNMDRELLHQKLVKKSQ